MSPQGRITSYTPGYVERLEAAHAAKDAALEDMVAIAAERVIQFPADGYFRQLYDIGGAALSLTAGEDWVSPAVREQVRRKVLQARLELDCPSVRGANVLVQNAVDYAQRSLNAALAALEKAGK